MEKVITHHKIQTYLTRLNDLLIISNKSGELSLTKICEGLICELFSIIENIDFLNTNLSLANSPSIDLHQPQKRIAIQVTSNTESKKITDSYEKFYKYKLDKKYDSFRIVVLATKKYDLSKLKEHHIRLRHKYSVDQNCNIQIEVITLSDLYNIISSSVNIVHLNRIRLLFERSFEEVKGINDLSDYYEMLRSLYFETVMDDEAGLTLNSIYVEPSFTIHESTANKECPDLKLDHSTDSYILKNESSVHDLLNARYRGNLEYNKLFANPRANVTFILGYPGQGKTSLCNRLLFDLLTSPRDKHIFYLKLRNISDTKTLIHNPFNVVYEELECLFNSGFDKKMLKNSIVILDGLDELYMKDNLTAHDIEVFCKGVIHETEKFKNWEVLITTRHGYIDFKKLHRENYLAINLKPLNIDRQTEWIEKYRIFHPESWLTNEKLIDFHNKTSSDKYILELLNQPLLLYIIASLESAINFKSNRSEIYNLLFDQIIDRKYSKDGQIENLKMLTKDDLRALLQEIAFLIFISGKGHITQNEILNNSAFQDYLSIIGNNHLAGTLKGILISFYFKERTNDTQNQTDAGIEFFHKSLQEYLTAERIVENIFNTLLNRDRQDKYIFNRNSEILNYLNNLLGRQEISFEIDQFIIELLNKKSLEEKEELLSRLILHIDYFFEKDFLNETKIDEVEPFRRGLLVFIAYWKLLKYLGSEKDFICGDEYKSYKLFSYQQTTRTLKNIKFNEYHLSYQTINNLYIDYFSLYEEYFINVNLISSTFISFIMGDVVIYNSSFLNCEFLNIELHNIYIDNLLMKHCEISDFQLSIEGRSKKIVFDNCDFDGKISIKGNRRNLILFKNSTFSKETYIQLSELPINSKFQNCHVRVFDLKSKNAFKYSDTPVEQVSK